MQQFIKPEAHTFDCPGGKVLDKHIGFGKHGRKQRLVRIVLQVQTDRLLATIQPDKIGAVPVDQRIIPAREITLGAFNLDHAGAGIGKS